MYKILDAWDCTKRGDYILILDEQLPRGFFKECAIGDKRYPITPVHISRPELLLKVIGIKAPEKEEFTGKEVEFVMDTATAE